MGTNLIPDSIRGNYEVHEWRHATAILRQEFPAEFKDVMDVLGSFQLLKSFIDTGGGSKSKVSRSIDSALYGRGWVEKYFDTKMLVDGAPLESPTHSVDCFKNRVALEIEWNNKDPFFDRDLNNFRLLFDLRVVSVGIVITRCDELQELFASLDRGKSYGASTTHMSKLLPKIEGGGGGGCPILVFGIGRRLYVEDR
jgi:Restriction endonuclease BglII